MGNGAYVKSITRSHDHFIEKNINVANQDVGRARAFAESMRSLEIIFSPELQASVSDEMTTFFNSFQDLSGFPEDFTVRSTVLESAKNLCAAFRRVDSDLRTARDVLNDRVFQSAETVSKNLSEIAQLNVKITTLEAGQGETANDLRDQRERLVREISQHLDIHYYSDKFGMMVVRGPSDVTLVDGSNASTINVRSNAENDGMFDVVCVDWEERHERILNKGLTGGELRGLLDARDDEIPSILNKNNEMASALVSSFNEIHRQGYGTKQFSEEMGRNFFKTPINTDRVAADLELDDAIYESVDAISSASSALAPGDNVIANQLVMLKDRRILGDGDTTLQEYYSNYVGTLGLTVQRAEHFQQANDILIEDLNKRREAIAGVSLDEEASNLLKWQTCFTANSKVITTVDEMLDTVLSLKR